MESMNYIGLDIHKKTIAYCIKTFSGALIGKGTVSATRKALTKWIDDLPQPWTAAMEATLFTGWVYDFLMPHAFKVVVAHPEMLKAITSAKKKNDSSDAEKITDLLRVDLLPECYMVPTELRELRRILRYRNFIIRISTKQKNKISGLLMEVGAVYSKKRLHGKRYFSELMQSVEDVPESVINMAKISHTTVDLLDNTQKELLKGLRKEVLIMDRVKRLMTIPGIGQITALTWVLEIGEPERFRSVKKAVSYCGLCAGQNQSAGKERRQPISKKRNKHLQTILVEAAKIAPIWNTQLAQVYEKEMLKGHRNRATLSVARKMVAYILAVEKSGKEFCLKEDNKAA